jgi:hypothetical protein
MRCDFCSSNEPVVAYPCRDFMMMSQVFYGEPESEPGIEYFAHPGSAAEVEEFSKKVAEQTHGESRSSWSRGPWAACLVCATFIDKDDYEGLVKRMNEDLADPSLPEALRKQCGIMNENNVRQFRANRTTDSGVS